MLGTAFTEIEQETLDLDWFFTDGDEIGFVASAGGKLPGAVSKSKEKLEVLFSYFTSLPQTCKVVINPDLNKIITDPPADDKYLSYFIDMAKKGLYSFDKTVLSSFSETNYHLVAQPESPLKIKDLPLEIMEIISGITTKRPIAKTLNISDF